MPADIKAFLEECVARYNCPAFIETDPISIPHRFSRLQDIEIIGFWAAILAWGQRKTIINSANRLIELMDGAPYDFIVNHLEKDRQRFLDFKHRTFQATDTLYFLEFFQQYYRQHHSLEEAFLVDAGYQMPDARHAQLLSSVQHSSLAPSVSPNGGDGRGATTEPALLAFHELFFSLPDAPARTRKHIPTPARKSTCKRLNMFLRWMVRHDNKGVDFGLWKKITPAQLLMPLDVHVDRVARRYGLLQREKSDWQAVLELTATLREFDAEDPVKYDFALFGLGVLEKDVKFIN
ncbi:MAG: TIGR02757 family protein [Saprospiraceae bacterium]